MKWGESKAKRESYAAVPETCPAVDAALANITAAVDVADGIIKEQTTALRDALIDALERAITAEEMAERLGRDIDSLRDRLRELEQELELAQELAERAGA